MERDFMGLNSHDPSVKVKEEVVEPSKDSEGFPKGSGVPWPSSRFVSVSSADGYDISNKHKPAELQAMHSAHLPCDFKMHPNSMGNPFFKSHFSSGSQNYVSPTMKQQIFGGIPLTNPHSFLPSNGFAAGTTEPWCNSKASGAPAQLTIFYAGAVQVYDDISPEKAQAIMFLAGNGCTASNVSPPKFQVQAPATKPPTRDSAFMNKVINTPPSSSLSSPLSVSSHPIGQIGAGPIEKEEVRASKTLGNSSTSTSKVETPKIVTSVGPVVATTIISSAVPQARKASLARFLEKRKERVLSSSPYQLNNKSAEGNTPGSNRAGFSATSGGGSTSVTMRKEVNL